MTFFQKVHFIQKCSVTQNTVFKYVKNYFLLSQKKLVFFTILNLIIILLTFILPRTRPDTAAPQLAGLGLVNPSVRLGCLPLWCVMRSLGQNQVQHISDILILERNSFSVAKLLN